MLEIRILVFWLPSILLAIDTGKKKINFKWLANLRKKILKS
jgi:hypothetical protein